MHGDRRKSVVNSKSLIGRLPKSFVSPKSNVFGRRAVRYNKINEQTQANKGETLSNTAVLEALLNAKKYPNVLKSPNKSQFDKTAARTIAKYNSITAKKPSSDSIKPFRLSGKFHGSLNSYLSPVKQHLVCEVCDFIPADYPAYLAHLQHLHQRCFDKSVKDLQAAPPLVCSRCSGRFHCYEGLERHLLMSHNLVTTDLLMKAQRKADSGRCQICTKVSDKTEDHVSSYKTIDITLSLGFRFQSAISHRKYP